MWYPAYAVGNTTTIGMCMYRSCWTAYESPAPSSRLRRAPNW